MKASSSSQSLFALLAELEQLLVLVQLHEQAVGRKVGVEQVLGVLLDVQALGPCGFGLSLHFGHVPQLDE